MKRNGNREEEENEKDENNDRRSDLEEILFFAIPLILGNLFQQLYNTVDSIIVGNYVGSNALAAVGSSGAIINLLIGFCIGASTGAGVIIRSFMGRKMRKG